MPDGTLTSFIRTHKAVLETAAKATLVSCFQMVESYSKTLLFSCTTFPLALNTVRCLLSYETTEVSGQVQSSSTLCGSRKPRERRIFIGVVWEHILNLPCRTTYSLLSDIVLVFLVSASQ